MPQKISKISYGPRKVWPICAYGLALSVSTQMLYSQLALYLKYQLKAGESRIALLDGVVEFISYLVRILVGILSDHIHNRKALMMAGCVILCAIKPIFAITTSVAHVMWAEIAERLANGIQACPRDALISELGDRKRLAAAFGLFKSMKTAGALLGAALATIIIFHWDYKILFWCSGIPAVLAMAVLWTTVNPSASQHKKTNPFRKKCLRSLDRRFWSILLLAAVCELSHFGESLLTLRASTLISPQLAGMTAAFMALGPALLAYPMGSAADKHGKILLLRLCLLLSIFAYVLMLFSDSPLAFFSGVMILCGQQASMQSIFLSLIGKYVDENLRATAIGLFCAVIGVSYMMASELCGQLWEIHGHSSAFTYGMVMSFLALIIIHVKHRYWILVCESKTIKNIGM